MFMCVIQLRRTRTGGREKVNRLQAGRPTFRDIYIQVSLLWLVVMEIQVGIEIGSSKPRTLSSALFTLPNGTLDEASSTKSSRISKSRLGGHSRQF